MKTFIFSIPVLAIIILLSVFGFAGRSQAAYHFSSFFAHSPLHMYATTGKTPVGVTPAEIKKIYNLPESGGKGTIVIIGAYDAASIEKDLADFDAAFGLPACTTKNGCLTRHLMSTKENASTGWSLETALDVEWAHAIAPTAKILLVEATTPSGLNLLKAVDYAAAQKGVSSISMSWGGGEFPEEVSLDAHFVSVSHAPFFASSGDSGAGASWPAASPNVIGVGGTSLALTQGGSLIKESAWQGSGGGVSAYEKAPVFQSQYAISRSGGMRAIPDVSYNADPASGFPIIHNGTWHTAGASDTNFYTDKSATRNASFFRDIVSGANGTCGYYCDARARYDYVTGLGTPQTITF